MIIMKEKNRFSVLLEHLTSMANLKNYVLAKAVQYDESYISKWISGKSLPTEKITKLFCRISASVLLML